MALEVSVHILTCSKFEPILVQCRCTPDM